MFDVNVDMLASQPGDPMVSAACGTATYHNAWRVPLKALKELHEERPHAQHAVPLGPHRLEGGLRSEILAPATLHIPRVVTPRRA